MHNAGAQEQKLFISLGILIADLQIFLAIYSYNVISIYAYTYLLSQYFFVKQVGGNKMPQIVKGKKLRKKKMGKKFIF